MDSTGTIDLAAIARALRLATHRVRAAVELLDAGNTVPFITRYRKDATGGLDEEQIRGVAAAVAAARLLAERKRTILRSIEAQGRLTPKLAAAIDSCQSPKRLEDLYLPFKPRKQTFATQARERGLAPLAEEIFAAAPQAGDLNERAAGFVSAEVGVATAEEALAGAGHILAEQFSELAPWRNQLRESMRKLGALVASRAETPGERVDDFRDYFEYRQPLGKVPPHRVLAINRGEKLKVLRVRIEVEQDALFSTIDGEIVPADHQHCEYLRNCARDALRRLIWPSLERELRRELTDQAESHAVEVFARNLRNLLLQPPVCGRRVLAVDPGFKSGCKLVALDEIGNVLAFGLVHLIGNDDVRADATAEILKLIREQRLDVVAIGNGAACRATEQLVAELIESLPEAERFDYVIVNEAGASVYSASLQGREELPQFEATVRSGVSIGRRLQDPLSELVKIDPPSIGVGLYQHDVKAKHLRESLDAVVASCVNFVGVDLNTASAALLSYVSGLNQLTARRLLEHRAAHGPFAERQALLDVAGLGEATFVQAAGFLKIADGSNPLDATWIHPENYEVAQRLLARFGFAPEDLRNRERLKELDATLAKADAAALAGELGIGELTLVDIVAQLTRPGRDPREDLPPPVFKRGILKLEDLAVGMELSGRVLNVVDFGAFVDIGLNYSGLAHLSQLADRYVANPHDIVSVGDIVTVWVLGIDRQRRRVSLSMLSPAAREAAAARRSGGNGEATDAESPQGPHGRSRPRRPRGRGKPASNGAAVNAQVAIQAVRPPKAKNARPRPVKPLSQAMQEGREPLRSFGELKLFFEGRPDENTSS